jgi:hypothetical protein
MGNAEVAVMGLRSPKSCRAEQAQRARRASRARRHGFVIR